MNTLQVPLIFNQFECHLTYAARTWLQFLLWLLENRSLIIFLYFCVFLAHSPSEFSCLLFSFLFELVLSSSMCQCAVTFSRRALVFGAVKRTCVAWAAQTRCPHTLWPGQTLDIWYVLLALCQACILFSCALTHCALNSLCYPFFVYVYWYYLGTLFVWSRDKTGIFSC